MRTLVVGVYTHPEYLPPTLNALESLSNEFDQIFVVHRNVLGFDWKYPSNVTLLCAGEQLSVREAEQRSVLYKIKAFLKFSFLLCTTFNKSRATALLVYDCMPLLSCWLMRFFMRKPEILWYHNHDVTEYQYIRKGSLSWWAWKSETWMFPRLTIFSLPALERKACFPMGTLRGKFFFLPNFPSKNIYKCFSSVKKRDSITKILYQGSVAPEHGLEEIIPLLNRPIGGKELRLVIKGFIRDEYKRQLEEIINRYSVQDKVLFIGPTGYKEVIENAFGCHIGIGIHKKSDIMNKTLGTASNKIYEYAAAGMPVLLYDNFHFREHLEKFSWAFFTDCTETSLGKCLTEICLNYEQLSKQAQIDFENKLNFDSSFSAVLSYINKEESSMILSHKYSGI